MEYLYGKLKLKPPAREPESPGERLSASSRPILAWQLHTLHTHTHRHFYLRF